MYNKQFNSITKSLAVIIGYIDIAISHESYYKVKLKSRGGDSGGAVFIPKTSTTATPIGIVSGADETLKYTFFTSIDSLPAELQTGRY